MSKKLTLLYGIAFMLAVPLYAQYNNVGIGTTTPHPSAILELQAINKGFLIVRSDTSAITSPATGLLIYRTSDSVFYYFNGIKWKPLFSGTFVVGPTGPQGPAGTAGVTGATGPAGIAGAKGATGPTGTGGINGVNGVTGPTGAFGNTANIDSIYSSYAQFDTLIASFASFDSLFSNYASIDSLFASYAKFDSVYALYANFDSVFASYGYFDSIFAAYANFDSLFVNGTSIQNLIDSMINASGTIGPTGPAGANGATGVTGTAGANGVTGPTGAAGTAGANGATGPTGAAGTAGANGATGPTGAAGTAGANGATGPTGPLVAGTLGQTLRHDGSTWVANSLLYNDGTTIGIGTTTPSASYKLHVAGRLKTDGTDEISDVRYKTSIYTINNPLEKVKQMRGVYFNWKTQEFPDRKFESSKQMGLIAQETEKVVPEVVHTDNNGFKSIEYSKLVALLLEAIKELEVRNYTLEQKILKIETENAVFKKQIESANASIETILQMLLKEQAKK